MGTNPWTYIFLFVVAIAGGATILGVLYGLVIAKVAANFSDKTLGNFTNQMTELLPGENCGKCGFKTCKEFANAVLRTETSEKKCPYLDEDTIEQMLECRENLQQIMEDPTPPKQRKESYWDRKF